MVEPFTHWFSEILELTPTLRQANAAAGMKALAHHFNWTIALVGSALVLGGVGIALHFTGVAG